MAYCNLTLYEVGYPIGMCDSGNTALADICYADTDDAPCPSAYPPGPIISDCIYFCASCPHFLDGMDAGARMAYLEPVMPPQTQRSGLFFSAVLSVLCVFGSVANFLTIVVILQNKVLQATSHYLLSLALSDLMMLIVTTPVEIKYQVDFWPWSSPQFFCRLQPYIKEACLYTTVLHIVAFTIERYIVICHPMRARTILSRSRALRLIVVIWMASFLMATPVFAVYAATEFCPGIPESSVCFPRYEADRFLTLFYGVVSIILFLVPMALIVTLYSLIARALFAKNLTSGRRQSTRAKQPARTVSSTMSAKRKKLKINDTVDKARHHAVKLLALVAVFFFVLWFPFMWIRFRPSVFTQSMDEAAYHEWYYSISMSLLYLSSCTNPVLYNVMSARFRAAYKNTILCREVRTPRMRDGSVCSKRSSRTNANLTSSDFTAF